MNELYYSSKCKSLFWITSNSNPVFVPSEMAEVKAAFSYRTDGAGEWPKNSNFDGMKY